MPSIKTPLLRPSEETPLIATRPLFVYNRTSLTLRIRTLNQAVEEKAVTAPPKRRISFQASPVLFHKRGREQLSLSLRIEVKGTGSEQRFAAMIVEPRPRARRPSKKAEVAAPNVDELQAQWSLLDLAVTTACPAEWMGPAEKPPPFLAFRSCPRQTTAPISLLVVPYTDPSTFLSHLPSSSPLSALTLPGTHESAAQYGWPISTCQPLGTIFSQLQRGIRFLDVRLSLKGGRLLAYHGLTDQRIELEAILTQVYAFLVDRPSETVLVSLKQENNVDGFMTVLLDNYIHSDRARWFLDPRIPTLGEVRGKIVLVSRFGRSDQQPGGIHPPIWPNSSPVPFRYALPSYQEVETQDWYDIGSLASLPSKFDLVTALFASSGGDDNVLSLNFTSASSFPLALPPFVAMGVGERAETVRCFSVEGINQRLLNEVCRMLCRQLGDENGRGEETALKVTFAMDYYDHPLGLVNALIGANF